MKDSFIDFEGLYPMADWIGEKVNLVAEKADNILEELLEWD